MIKRDYYETPSSTRIMRALWKAAGGDRYILERATYSDQIKYMCLGGIIVSTGLMASFAGGYAFYTIFSPKDEDGWMLVSPLIIILAILFGVFWGLIIYNIDRFIVTSTGKGDGTDKITWDEFKSAIPRIIMGAVIAITISTPMEIRIFQSEIQSGLIEEKQIQEQTYVANVNKRWDARIKNLQNEISNSQNEINSKKINWINSIDNAKAVCPQGGVNCSVGTHRKLWQVASQDEQDWKNTELRLIPEINKSKSNLTELENSKREDLNKARKDGEGTDGMAARIKQMHKKVPGEISLFITLLFLVIELTPIFFKLMLTKTPYDYLTENRDDLIRAESGIEVKYEYYTDKKGIERHLVINHEAEKLVFERSKLAEIQRELTEYALQKYKEREQKKIDENLDMFISSDLDIDNSLIKNDIGDTHSTNINS